MLCLCVYCVTTLRGFGLKQWGIMRVMAAEAVMKVLPGCVI